MIGKLFASRKDRRVTFCDECGRVCDERCRAEAAREAAVRRELPPRFA